MSDDSLSEYLPRLQLGDQDAMRRIWEHYYSGIVAFANQRLVEKLKRVVDGDDLAQSAFKSCFRAIQEGRASNLQDRDNLWALLTTITARKVINANVHFHTEKEGAGKVGGESVFEVFPDMSTPGIQAVPDKCRPVEMAIALTEQTELLLDSVDEDTRQVTILHLQGYKDREISDTLGFSIAKVERKLKKIRRVGRRIAAAEDDRDSNFRELKSMMTPVPSISEPFETNEG